MKLRFRMTRQRLAACLLIGSVGCCFAGPQLAAAIRPVVQVALVPFADGGMYLATTFRSHMADVTSGRVSQEEARKLQEQVAQYRRENDYLVDYSLAIRKQLMDLSVLSKAFEPTNKFAWKLIAGRIVMADSLPYGRTRVINVGGDNGVRPGEKVLLTDRAKAVTRDLPVVAGSVLVGRIAESSAQAARLQLVTDSGFRQRVRVFRDPHNRRDVAVEGKLLPLTLANSAVDVPDLQGDGAGGMIIPNVQDYLGIAVGDRVVTRDADLYLPAAVAVGEVTAIRKYNDQPKFLILVVRPAVDLESLRDVYVVVPGESGE